MYIITPLNLISTFFVSEQTLKNPQTIENNYFICYNIHKIKFFVGLIMDKEILQIIDKKIEEYTENLINDTIKLVNINSENSASLPGAPFGEGPRKMLDTVLEMGKNAGFATNDYNVGVISLAMDSGSADLGIWAHGDVVPAGEGWDFEPYNATVYKNEFIIGRGSADNKGQLAAIFNLFKIFKELNINLNYNPALFVGSNEETGMKDMVGLKDNPDAKGFINVYTPPRLSLVPDGGFPIGYGAKGMGKVYIKSKTPFSNFSLTAGQTDAPGKAEAVFETLNFPDSLPECNILKTDKTFVSSFSQPRHASSPDPNGNMITQITNALIGSGCVNKNDLSVLTFLRDISLDIHGEKLGIYHDSEIMGKTIVSTTAITCENGYPELQIRLRYPIETPFDILLEKMSSACEKSGFTVKGANGHSPYVQDDKSEVCQTLCKIANEITETDGKPYINGATYAHYLPNAYIFGMSSNSAPDDFKDGRGGAHGIDESVSIPRLKRAMRIYARTLLALNEIKW